MAFAALAVFVEDARLQTMLALVALLALVVLQVARRPYREEQENTAALLSLVALFVTRAGSTAFGDDGADGGDEGGVSVRTVVLVAWIAAVNVCAVGYELRLVWARHLVPACKGCVGGRGQRDAVRRPARQDVQLGGTHAGSAGMRREGAAARFPDEADA